VDETFHTRLDFHESAVRHQLGDLAADAMTCRETSFDVFPRIALELLEAERDALFLFVDVENLDRDGLANREHFAPVIDPAPAHVGDVEQTVHPGQVDERTEVGEDLDHAFHLIADANGIEELGTLFRALRFDDFPTGEDDVLPVVVDLDDLEFVNVADGTR